MNTITQKTRFCSLYVTQPGNRKRQHESCETSCNRTVAHTKRSTCTTSIWTNSVCCWPYHKEAESCFSTNQWTAKYKLATEQEIIHLSAIISMLVQVYNIIQQHTYVLCFLKNDSLLSDSYAGLVTFSNRSFTINTNYNKTNSVKRTVNEGTVSHQKIVVRSVACSLEIEAATAHHASSSVMTCTGSCRP